MVKLLENDVAVWVIILIIWNVTTFFLMGMDKRNASKNRWRLSERALLACAFLAGAAGVLVGSLVYRHKTKKKKFKVLLALALVVNILVYVILGYLSICAPADQEALLAMQSDEQVQVIETQKEISFTPLQEEIKGGLIYYPGAQVAPQAFAYAARNISEEGYVVCIAKMPFQLAIFGIGRADEIVAAHPEVENWAISGFSLGGVAACMNLAGGQDRIDTLILYASYPSEGSDLSNTQIHVLSLSGENDGLATPDKIQAAKKFLPQNTTYIQIPGANHTGFALYGGDNLQKGDHPAEITKMEQQQIVIEETVRFLNENIKK